MNVDFSSFLKNAMRMSGKTQKEIASDAGIALSALANYVSGSREPQLSAVFRLCDACGVDPVTMFAPSQKPTFVDIEKPVKQVLNTMKPNINRAARLLNCSADELAVSAGAKKEDGKRWASGEASPSYDQLVNIYHQVLAVASACCTYDHRTSDSQSRKAVG